jgi:hypothetical protein
MLISTKDLGLAAYIKSKGLALVSCEDRVFFFETGSDDESVMAGLEVQYANSCCRQHDGNVMYLRSMTKLHPKKDKN